MNIGGPNGCIDFINTSDNKGLESVVAQLQPIYTQYAALYPGLSRADFWVIAANTVVKYASTTPASKSILFTHCD